MNDEMETQSDQCLMAIIRVLIYYTLIRYYMKYFSTFIFP